jgi:diguanylate cyclase (GGDEF)-like protein/PAS domain S-box-containing protein
VSRTHFSIATQIHAAFGVLLLSVLAFGAVYLERLSAMNDVALANRDDFLPSERQLGQLRTSVRQYRIEEAGVLLARDPPELASAQAQLQQAAQTVERARAANEPLITPGTDDRRFMDAFDAAWRAYRASSARLAQGAGAAGGAQRLREAYGGAEQTDYRAAIAAVTDDIVLNFREGVDAENRAIRNYSLTRWMGLAAFVAALLTSTTLGVLLSRTLAHPVRLMTVAMQRLAAGDYGVAIPSRQRRDELGMMAASLEQFRVGLAETERLRARENAQTAELRDSEARFRTVFDSVTEGIFIADSHGRFVEVNPSGCQMFGYTREELIGSDIVRLSSGAPPYTQLAAVEWISRARRDGPQTFEWHCQAKGGRLFWAEICARITSFAGREVSLATLRDVSDRKEAERRIRQMVRQDALTGLPNRQVLVDAVEGAIARVSRDASLFAVMFLDLDHFKDVNDTLGHPAGDDLLRAVAARLRGAVRNSDLVVRFGGDEFAVLMPEVREDALAGSLAAKLIAALDPPFSIQGNDIRIGTSIGIAVGNAATRSVEAMLAHADVALYRAKAEGRGTYRFFDDSMDAKVRARVTLVAQLREAIESGQLFLVYQPQVELSSGRVTGIEALVRWRHPERGILTPGQFIAEAESSGLIVPLGRVVLREACRQARLWSDSGLLPARMAVNLSAAELRAPLELEQFIRGTLTETGLDPRRLEVELTETVLMGNGTAPHQVLAALRALGIGLAIDDFGTGFSSLDYLRRFPADRLKIAREFVDQLERAGNAAVVKATIGLARELGMAVIAEGVETERQVDLLSAWGCSDGQGFHFARPMTAQELEPMLRAGTTRSGRHGVMNDRVVQGPWTTSGRYRCLS